MRTIPDIAARLRKAGDDADRKLGDKRVGDPVQPCPNRVAIRIVDVEGLFQPAKSGPRPAGTPGATRVVGYVSADQRGRIFLNRNRTTGAWTPGQQSIEITAEITVIAGVLPPDAEVRWTVGDPDDPSDDDFGMSDEWGPYVDRNDYDGSLNKTAKRGDDNAGKINKTPRWEQSQGGFSLTVVSDTEARTKIVPKRNATTKAVVPTSKVVVHCPDLPGDNLVVKAEIAPGKVQVVGGPDQTGVMTLWNRIDVEYVKMASAYPLPVDEIPQHYEMMFAQLDITAPVPAPDIGADASNFDQAANRAFKKFSPICHKLGHDGWFCLVAGLEAYPVTPAGAPFATLTNVTIDNSSRSGDFADVPHIQGIQTATMAQARIKWTDAQNNALWRVFDARISSAANGQTRIEFREVEYKPVFTAVNGPANEPVDTAILEVWPTRQKIRAGLLPIAPPGFGIPTTGVTVELFHGGSGKLLGLTASRDPIGAAPLTVIFTTTIHQHASGFLLQTCIHELGHAYGLDHKCGFWDYHAGKKAACAMTYPDDWVLDATASDHLDDLSGPARMRPQPGTENKSGPDSCGRHIKEARRFRLQDNLALGWRR